MDISLDTIEARVLGCLIEKELATPEYYPLTVNALVNACNQKSNRDPVMVLAEDEVQRALDNLRFEQLAHKSAEGVRTTKYCHNLEGTLRLEPEELSILAVLLLRGPQTLGELRTRTERMHSFPSLDEVESTLEGLFVRDMPLVVKLPRQPGRKEHRYAHLLCGEVTTDEPSTATADPDPRASKPERLSQLEEDVASLRSELDELRMAFEQFRAQFD